MAALTQNLTFATSFATSLKTSRATDVVTELAKCNVDGHIDFIWSTDLIILALLGERI